MKKYHYNYMKQKNDMDLMVAVSKKEKEILVKSIGIESEKIAVTGFSRFDKYFRSASSDQNAICNILYMPTWRDWISENHFIQSKMFKQLTQFLGNKYLNDLLDRHDCKMTFLMHINMRQHAALFESYSSSNLTVISSNEVNLHDLILENNLLITDYSSISWDFLYLKKPVIFFRFDLSDY